jgi:hypothetical protein
MLKINDDYQGLRKNESLTMANEKVAGSIVAEEDEQLSGGF